MGKKHGIYFADDVYDIVTTLKTLHGNISLNKVVNELCRLGFKEYDKFVTTSVEALIEDINRQMKDVKAKIRGINQVKDAILMSGAFSENYRKELNEGSSPSMLMDDRGKRRRVRVGLVELKEQGLVTDVEYEAIHYLIDLREELAQHLAWLVVQHKRLNAKRKGKLVTVQTTVGGVK